MAASTSEERTLELSVLRCAAGTDVGMRRDENQDSFGIVKSEHFRAYFVADGMGGVHGGAVASRIAVSGLEELLQKERAGVTSESIGAIIGELNRRIFDKGRSDPTLAGMGTTLVGIIFTPHASFVINIGDSRLYRIRGKSVRQLTEDHTLVRELLKSGAISPDQAENHPVSHMLTRSLGPIDDVQVDCRLLEEPVQVGDYYILCSDGLYNFVSDEELLEVVRQNPIDDANQILINLANQRGGTDNITVLVIAVGERVDRGRSAAYRQARDQSSGFHDDTVVKGDPGEEPGPETMSQTDTPEDAAVDGGVGGDAGTRPERPPAGKSAGRSQAKHNRDVASDEKQAVAPQVEEPRVDTRRNRRRAISVAQDSGLGLRAIPVYALLIIALVFGLLVGSLARKYVPIHGLSEITAFNLPGLSHEESTSNGEDQNERQQDAITSSPEREGQARSFDRTQQIPDGEQGILSLEGGSGDSNSDQSSRVRMVETKQIFETSIAKLEKQLFAFGKPASPELVSRVVEHRKQADELSARQAEVQQSIDAASRKLSQWFIRLKRLETQDSIQLAAEVGATSDIVQQKKRAFESATYEFIAKRDELELYPSNERLRQEVEHLKEQRVQALRSLRAEIENTVKSVLNETEQQLYELKFRYNMLDLQLQSVKQDLDFAKVISEPNEQERAAMKRKIEQKLRGLRASLAEVNAMLGGKR